MSIPASFGVSATSGVLASWLGQSSTAGGLSNIISGTSTSAGGLTALLAHANSGVPSTTQALEAGALTTSQQRVIQAIGDNTGALQIPWNSTGTEPTTVANIRAAGWIKLDKKIITDGKVTGGTYELTKLGQAIYNRTGGGNVDGSTDSTLTSAETNGTTTSSGSTAAAAADANLQSSVSSLTSILGSLGISA
jgi:hypothetical protein